jgi:hypothetical protein
MKKVVVLVATCLAPCIAFADEPTAADLKKQGDDAAHAFHFHEALDLYDRSYALSHDPAILYNRARANQALGNYPTALDDIEEFVRIAPDDLKRRVPLLADLVADIRDHVGLLVVTSTVQGAKVKVQGKVAGATPMPGPVKVGVGTVTVDVEAPGYLPLHRDVSVAGGKMTTLDATLVSETAAHAGQETPAKTDVPGSWRAGTYIVGAVGLASLGVGVTFGGLAAMRQSDANAQCPGKVCNPSGWADISDARTFATVSNITLIAGGLLAVGAVVMWLVAPHAMRRVPVAALLSPHSAGLSGTF